MTLDLTIPLSFQAPQVSGLDHQTQDLLDRLVKVWAQKRPRNALRTMYLDGKSRARDLGISIPPALRDLEIVLGWPEKAVYGSAQRSMWDRVVSPDGSEDPFELSGILHDNQFDLELANAIVASQTHSVSFISTLPGDVASGEPEVLIMMHSAEWAAGIWDRRRRALAGLLLVSEVDDLQRPVELIVLTPFESVTCVQGAGGWYVSDARPQPLGRTPGEPLPYRPTLDRPFGRSRISRQVMSITDRAVRAGLRLDVHGEFFSAAQFLLFGADDDAFKDAAGNPIPMWDWYIGRFKTISRDENGDLPELHEIAQKDPTPHIATTRQLAGEFSGATAIPLASLGIVHDNPNSAQAMYAAKEDLVIEASSANRGYSPRLSRIYQNVVMLRDGLDELTDELRRLSTKWFNPAFPSVVSSSDAMVKQISAIPWIGETDVALEQLGYDSETITRMLAQKRRAESDLRLRELMSGRSVAQVSVSDSTNPADETMGPEL